MTINRSKTTIDLTKEEREAIKTVAKLTHDLYYNLNEVEVQNFNGIMKTSWRGNADDTDNIEVGILDFIVFLMTFKKILTNLISDFFTIIMSTLENLIKIKQDRNIDRFI